MLKKEKPEEERRNGTTEKRSQSFNSKIRLWTKRDTSKGRFIDLKTSEGKFKGVSKEN